MFEMDNRVDMLGSVKSLVPCTNMLPKNWCVGDPNTL